MPEFNEFEEMSKQADKENTKQAEKQKSAMNDWLNYNKKHTTNYGVFKFIKTNKEMYDAANGFYDMYLGTTSPLQIEFTQAATENRELSPFMQDLGRFLQNFNRDCCERLKIYGAKQKQFQLYDNNMDYKNAMRDVKKSSPNLLKELNELMKYKESDSVEFRKVLTDAMDILSNVDRITIGNLQKPAKGEKYENGKKINIVDNFTMEQVVNENGETVMKKKYHNPDVDKKLQKRVLAKNDKKESAEKGVPVKTEVRYETSDIPLFDHEPCPEDIRQGAIGDCYMMSCLASIASKEPEIIRNMMVDNEDGTVTVRLFNDQMEPTYVTVEKSVPMIYKTVDGVENKYIPYSSGSFWVAMVEKAYATIRKSGPLNKYGSYQDLDSGDSLAFGRAVLGPAAFGTLKEEEYDTPKTKKGNNYSKAENDLYNNMLKAHDEGHIVTAHSIHVSNVGDDGEKIYQDFKGLPPNHGYAVLDLFEVGGRKFVKVKNPHSAGGRVIQGNKLEFLNERTLQGESILEFRNFCHSFRKVSVNKFENTLCRRAKAADVKDTKRLYGDALLKACDIIDKWDNVGIKLFGNNSDEFAALRTAALGLKREFAAKPGNIEELKRKMDDLFTAANDYKQYRINNPKEVAKEFKDSSANRFFAADMICNIAEKYNSDSALPIEQRSSIDYDNLATEILFTEKDQSSAAIAMRAVVGARKESNYGILPADSFELTSLKYMHHNSVQNMKMAMASDNSEMCKEAMKTFLYTNEVLKQALNMDNEKIGKSIENSFLKKGCETMSSAANKMFNEISKKDFQKVFSARDPIGKMKELVDSKLPKIRLEEAENAAKSNGIKKGFKTKVITEKRNDIKQL